MAGFRMHITVSTAVGVVYGGAVVQPMGFNTETGLLAAGLTAVGGMLPDLDSDSGVPLRELSGLAAAIIPMLLVPRMMEAGFTREGVIASMLFGYLFVRYGLTNFFRRFTVHRGMYHSLPAMVIAGLLVYLGYGGPDPRVRMALAVGVMLGFLSHLVLDEIYSVDLSGLRIKLKSSAGSAVKMGSSSFGATALCYLMLGGLLYLVFLDQKYAGPESTVPSAALSSER